VIRRHAAALWPEMSSEQRRVLSALASCRTAALGGHVEVCDCCGHQHVAYNSCRNRHCPKCQGSACASWMEERAAELLPVEYFHVVFTLPNTFNALALANRRVVYGVLFAAASQTLLEVAANPRHLGARIGFLAVLHTWGQNLSLHPHLHCIVPGGGLSPDADRWIGCRPGFFLPVRVLSRVFRGKFIDLLRKAFHRGKLRGRSVPADAAAFEKLLDSAVGKEWVVYAKPPFGGPAAVLAYLARYTHRVAIANSRLVSLDDHAVRFRWKDYRTADPATGAVKIGTMALGPDEFIRRFLLHVLPAGFHRIRHYGLLAKGPRAPDLHRLRTLIAAQAGAAVPPPEAERDPIEPEPTTSPTCPGCGGPMRIIEVFARGRTPRAAATLRLWMDSS
jgi:Putative transposase/Transposase zinc-binding domain